MSEAYEVPITGLGVSGEGVGRLEDGRVVFVPGTLPGDRVEVSIDGTERKHRAELLRILTPSGDRVTSECAERACGGCPLQELSIAGQVAAKRSRIVDSMRRIGGIVIGMLFRRQA